MVKTTDLVAAMRCSSQTPTSSPPCTTCAYRVVETLDGKEYTSCDCDRMGIDAADRLEELVDRCARYAEEIAVLRERVRLYEDTGLTPKEAKRMSNILLDVGIDYNCSWEYVKNLLIDGRLRELAEADKEERVVVLPVKPVLTPILSSMLYIIEDGDIYEDALYEAVVGMSESGKVNVVYTTLSDQIIFEQADIGKTVFLIREAAKEALEEMEGV